MKRKVIFGALAALFLGGGIVTTLNLTQKEQVSDLTLANIEAITMDDADGWISDITGCNGGERKCFTGSISYKGVTISGTWYMH